MKNKKLKLPKLKKSISIALSAEIHNKLKNLSVKQDISISAIVSHIICDSLDCGGVGSIRRKKKNKPVE